MTSQQSPDEILGRNLQELRKASGLSQTELADELTKAGLPFRQQTVLKIEKGHRPLKAFEAVRIASILDVEVQDLLSEAGRVDRAAVILDRVSRVEQAWEDLRQATATLLDEQGGLAAVTARIPESVSQSIANRAATLGQLDPVEIVGRAVVEHQARADLRSAELESGVDVVTRERDDDGER